MARITLESWQQSASAEKDLPHLNSLSLAVDHGFPRLTLGPNQFAGSLLPAIWEKMHGANNLGATRGLPMTWESEIVGMIQGKCSTEGGDADVGV